jgi:indolepyruvate ferredoxin oxidoreductase beta subunit
MMNQVKNLLLVGVGGQGTILVSKILTQGLIKAGYDVKMSEIHGMAQRGGSVSTQVRYGDKVYSPIIGRGGADILVAFEKMEAVRYSELLKPTGIAVINNYAIAPMPVAAGTAVYPEGSIEAMSKTFKTIFFNAAEIAQRIGNSRTMNIVLFGAMVKAFGMTDIDWEEALRDQLPEKLLEVNLKAFRTGGKMV